MLFGFGAAAAALFTLRAVRGRSATHQDDRPDRAFDPIQTESDDSFPASDPPSHTSTTGASVQPPGIH